MPVAVRCAGWWRGDANAQVRQLAGELRGATVAQTCTNEPRAIGHDPLDGERRERRRVGARTEAPADRVVSCAWRLQALPARLLGPPPAGAARRSAIRLARARTSPPARTAAPTHRPRRCPPARTAPRRECASRRGPRRCRRSCVRRRSWCGASSRPHTISLNPLNQSTT